MTSPQPPYLDMLGPAIPIDLSLIGLVVLAFVCAWRVRRRPALALLLIAMGLGGAYVCYVALGLTYACGFGGCI